MKPLSQTRQAIVEELFNTYGEFTWWIDNDHSIDVEIPPEMKSAVTKALNDYTESIVRMVEGKKKDFLWLAFDDETGKEYIVGKEGYKKLPMEYSGHTIQSGYNQALNDIKEELNK